MDLTQGGAFDAEQDPQINHAMEEYSRHIFVYGIDSAYMERPDGSVVIDEEAGIFPLTLLILCTMGQCDLLHRHRMMSKRKKMS